MLSFLRQTSPRFMKKKTRDYDLAAWGYTLVMDTGDSWVYTPMEPGHPTIIIEVVLGEWYAYRVLAPELDRDPLTDNKSWKRFLRSH